MKMQKMKMKIVVIMNDTALTLAQSNGLIYYSTTHTSQRLLSPNLLATSVVTLPSIFVVIYTHGSHSYHT